MLDHISLAIASLAGKIECLFVFKRLHAIRWYETGECSPYETEKALKQRGIKVYGRDIEPTEDESVKIVTERVPYKQRPWAEEIVFVQLQKQPAGKILPKTEQRLLDGKGGYTSKRWSPNMVWSRSPLDFAMRVVAGIFGE